MMYVQKLLRSVLLMFQFPPRISSTAYLPITATDLTIQKICYSLQTTQMV